MLAMCMCHDILTQDLCALTVIRESDAVDVCV